MLQEPLEGRAGRIVVFQAEREFQTTGGLHVTDITEDVHAIVAESGVIVLMGSAGESIPVADGEPCLGTWQRVLFIELDRSRPRRWMCKVVGSGPDD